MILLSIVVPAFNASEYISTCLNSVFQQVDQCIEVILVDDGSTDNTLEIVFSEFSSHIESSSLIIIRQANGGPGAARNRGIDLCRGRYITFLDSDDLLLEGYFMEVMPLLLSEPYDIIEHGFIRFSSKKELIYKYYKPLYNYSGSYDLKDIRNKVFAKTVWYPSIRIFKNSIWHSIRFTESVFYEDPMTINQIFLQDYTIYYSAKPFLGYRINPKSITSTHSSSHMMDLANFYFSLKDNCIPLIILKIRLARSILYFYHELGINDHIMSSILLNVRYLPKNIKILYNLKSIDLFFILFTRAYILLDKARFMLGK
jgi:glycosyltransferase involved in cell wall biosynthesis